MVVILSPLSFVQDFRHFLLFVWTILVVNKRFGHFGLVPEVSCAKHVI